MRTIRVSDEVWREIQKQAEPLIDTPDSVLRRKFGLSPKGSRAARAHEQGAATPTTHANSARPAMTQRVLAERNVDRFVHNSGATAKNIGTLLDAARVPHYFSKVSHDNAGCGATGGHKTKHDPSRQCPKDSHGDEAGREVLNHLDALAGAGWRVRYKDGRVESLTAMKHWVT